LKWDGCASNPLENRWAGVKFRGTQSYLQIGGFGLQKEKYCKKSGREGFETFFFQLLHFLLGFFVIFVFFFPFTASLSDCWAGRL